MSWSRFFGVVAGILVSGYWLAPDEVIDPIRHLRKDPNLAMCQANLESLGQAVEQYRETHQGELPENLHQLVPEQVATLPLCPAAKMLSYRYGSGHGAGIVPGSGADSFLITCAGGYHKPWGMRGRFPLYDSSLGFLTSEPGAQK